jgi:hypothetical protein
MSPLEIKNLSNLQDYLMQLGFAAVSLRTIHALQCQALRRDFLADGEREQVETIKYEIAKAFVAISNLLNHMENEGIVNIKEINEKIQKLSNNKCKGRQNE